MRIAQVSPLYESTPPKTYGGVERIAAFLTDELTAQGHEVTLFATADSTAKASRLVAGCDTGLRTSPGNSDPVARHLAMLGHVAEMADEFDVIHFHFDHLHLPLARERRWPHVTTLHGRLDIEDRRLLYLEYPELPMISISDSQRRPIPELNWKATVYNGLPESIRKFSPEGGGYLAFMGRVAPEKGLDQAIQIARRSGMPLKIAAKIDQHYQDYYHEEIEPFVDRDGIEFLGEIGGSQKDEFFGNARALLFPIDWPEPFGLVMIEAFACGTPVVAYPRGAVPEVVEDGITGFVVDDVESAVAAVGRLDSIDRRVCRERFEQRFSARRMVRGYLDAYQSVIADMTSSV